MIQDTGLLRHKRFLFSCDCPVNTPVPDRIRELAEKLSCTMLYIPPLRSRADELPAMATQYLKHLSAEAGKELAGLEPRALELISAYDWPNNYAQLRQVLNELAAVTPMGYVGADAVAEILTR